MSSILDTKIDKAKDYLDKQHKTHLEAYTKKCDKIDHSFVVTSKKIRDLRDEATSHMMMIKELKDFKEYQTVINAKFDDKIKRNKNQAWDELCKVKDEANLRIDICEKDHNSFADKVSLQMKEMRLNFINDIDQLRET